LFAAKEFSINKGIKVSVMDLFYDIPTLRLRVVSSMACLTAYLPAGRAKGIPLGMPRSVDNRYSPVLHPVRDASLTGCKEDTTKYSTERRIPNGMQSLKLMTGFGTKRVFATMVKTGLKSQSQRICLKITPR
jgi:hypothetical protein